MSRQTCPVCDELFSSVGHHWRYNPSHRPDITKRLGEIVTGLVMGDGTVHFKERNNAHVACEMTNQNYLQHLDEVFGCLSQGVKLKHTAKESAMLARDSGFRPNAKAKNYSDKYYWACSSHPALNKFSTWYESGKKVWPDNIDLTPTTLKHWYAGDGHLDVRGSYSSISIGVSNEADEKNKINKMFSRENLPAPKWTDYEDNEGYRNCQISFSTSETDELLSYMGAPVPGFEYKWGNE